MRVFQLMPTLGYGDAIGNYVLEIAKLIKEKGIETKIYAINIDSRYPTNVATTFDKMPKLNIDDILIYHAGIGTFLNTEFLELGGKAVVVYHNITPPHYFEKYNTQLTKLTRDGYEQIKSISKKVKSCIAVSNYNRNDLIKMGYDCPIDVCPLIIPFDDYCAEPDGKIVNKYEGDGYTNLLFVGRISPNKCQQDVIRLFYAYHKLHNSKSRLFLVGNNVGMEKYDEELKKYAKKLGVEEFVVFTGHIDYNSVLAYYRLADIFVSMSEHEGFCVPLVEAMIFEKPIIAYSSSAVDETLGDGGLLLDSKNPIVAADAINYILTNNCVKDFYLQNQKKNLKRFNYESTRKQFWNCIENIILKSNN